MTAIKIVKILWWVSIKAPLVRERQIKFLQRSGASLTVPPLKWLEQSKGHKNIPIINW